MNCGPGVRSLAANVRSPHWSEVVKACCEWADVVIVGSRPVDAVRRGLDFDTVVGLNPDIVYCAITGYGDVGPWRNQPAHGQQMDAFAGNVPLEWGWTVSHARHADSVQPARLRRRCLLPWASGQPSTGVITPRRGRVASLNGWDVSCWAAAMSWQWARHDNSCEPRPYVGQSMTRPAVATRCMPPPTNRALLLCPLERKYWEVILRCPLT